MHPVRPALGAAVRGGGRENRPGRRMRRKLRKTRGFRGLESGWKVAGKWLAKLAGLAVGLGRTRAPGAVGMRPIVPPHGRVWLARGVHRRARLRSRIVAFVRVSPTRASASRASARSCGAAPDAAGGDGGARTCRVVLRRCLSRREGAADRSRVRRVYCVWRFVTPRQARSEVLGAQVKTQFKRNVCEMTRICLRIRHFRLGVGPATSQREKRPLFRPDDRQSACRGLGRTGRRPWP